MMKKTVNKFLACIMAVLLLMSSLPMMAVSAEALVTDDGFKYAVENGAVTITGFTNAETATQITIPDTIDGLAVKKIGNWAFREAVAASITLPETLEEIMYNAFEQCSNLTAVDIPDSVTVIGSRAFLNCTALKDVTLSKNLIELGYLAFENTAIESIEIPKSLDKADSWPSKYTLDGVEYEFFGGPFFKCENLKTVTFEKGVTQIAESLFAGAVGLEEITIPDAVTVIENSAFEGCVRLKGIVIPDSVTSVQTEAFAHCVNLKDATLSKSLSTLGSSAFENTAIESIEIPRSMDEAGFYFTKYSLDGIEYEFFGGPFLSCENLKTVTFQKGTTQIAKSLFAGAVGLEEITIPDTVTVIENSAFEGCVRLKGIVIPDSVTTVQEDAFSHCVNLKDVTLSKSLSALGSSAFENTAIESIEIPKSLDQASVSYTQYTLDGVVYGLYIGPFFSCENLKTVTFEEGTTQIAQNLFAGAVGLEKIEIPDTVTIIETSAFDSCVRLTDVTIPQSVTSIGYEAFKSCINLKEITLPNSISVLRQGIFDGCSSLESITLPEPMKEIEFYAFRNCTALKEFAVPEGVKKIGFNAFENCTALEKISIPQSTKEIGYESFAGCEMLTTVEIADYSITELERNMFKDCFELAQITLPKGLETIEKEAFVNCVSLYDVVIPESVTSIDDTAFSYPSKTTIYSQTGSYVEQFANDGGFKFVDNVIEADTITLENAEQNIYLKAGENLRLKFNLGPAEANEVVKLTADGIAISVFGHDIVTSRWGGSAKVIAETGSGASYEFTVKVRTVDEIQVTAAPKKTVYAIGEELDLAGLVVQSLYDDEYTEEITDYTVTGFDSTKAGKTIVMVGWSDLLGENYTATFEVEVTDPNAFAIGDANLDGTINIKDATAIQKFIASLEEFTPEQMRLADFNEDTAVNIKDATTIQKKIAGLL